MGGTESVPFAGEPPGEAAPGATRAGGYPGNLTTARLRLRRPRMDDAQWFATMNADPEVMRFIGGARRYSHGESDRALDAVIAHWERTSFGLWFAERLDTAQPIGFVGLAVPTFLPEVLPAVEVGWRLARAHWGSGFATEGARAAMREGFTTLDLERIVSITVHDNLRSQNTMARLGLTWDRAAVHPGLGLIVQVRAISRHAWAARAST